MYGCESWTVKKAEHRRIDACKLCCWRRLLWVPWTARRSNQSILKGISLEYSLEGLMLKLKLQYFGQYFGKELTHWKRAWCWEGLKTGGKGDDRGWDGWMASLIQWTWIWTSSRSWWWTRKPGMLQSMGWQSQTWLNWSEEMSTKPCLSLHPRSPPRPHPTTLDATYLLPFLLWLLCPGWGDTGSSFLSSLLCGLVSVEVCVCGVPHHILSSLLGHATGPWWAEMGKLHGESLQTEVPGSCLGRQTRISRDRSLP